MENKLSFHFIKENIDFDLDITQPDLAKLVHLIIDKNILVTKENIIIETQNDDFDIDEFIEILIAVNEEFKDEIELFYENIKSEISTYYSKDELSQEIINKIKNDKLDMEEAKIE